MMRIITAFLALCGALLLMTGCQNQDPAFADTKPPAGSVVSGEDTAAAEPPPAGTTETFTHGDLVLEISNVCQTRMDTGIYDNGDPYEFPVYVCAPGAVLSVVNADMEHETAEAPDPAWGLYDWETDRRTPLTDGMEPVFLDDTTDAVFHLEASVVVLMFEFAE